MKTKFDIGEKVYKKFMKIPKFIQIGQVTYEIILNDNISENYEVWGTTNTKTQRIYLSETLTQERLEETLIHELLHACICESNLDYFLKKENVNGEDIISTIDSYVYQVVKQLLKNEAALNQYERKYNVQRNRKIQQN